MTVRVAGIATALLVTALALTGCGAPSGGNGATGDNGAATSGPADEGDGDAGDGDTGTDELSIPDTFPRDEVPLIEGDVAYSQDLGTGWVVYIHRDDFLGGYEEAKGPAARRGLHRRHHGVGRHGFRRAVHLRYVHGEPVRR